MSSVGINFIQLLRTETPMSHKAPALTPSSWTPTDSPLTLHAAYSTIHSRTWLIDRPPTSPSNKGPIYCYGRALRKATHTNVLYLGSYLVGAGQKSVLAIVSRHRAQFTVLEALVFADMTSPYSYFSCRVWTCPLRCIRSDVRSLTRCAWVVLLFLLLLFSSVELVECALRLCCTMESDVLDALHSGSTVGWWVSLGYLNRTVVGTMYRGSYLDSCRLSLLSLHTYTSQIVCDSDTTCTGTDAEQD